MASEKNRAFGGDAAREAPESPPSSARRRLRVTICLLLVLYSVGVLGMHSMHRARFIDLSFANLLITSGLLLWNAHSASGGARAEPGLERGAALSFVVCIVVGFLVELLGVSTGFPFGQYVYTSHLGPRWLGVPLIIGLNWATLVHATQALLSQTRLSRLSRWGCSALGASLMTAFDGLLEPAAITLGFWVWEGAEVPPQNYAAWWVISYALLWLGLRLSPGLRNPAAGWVLGVQALFFWLVTWSS